MERLFPIDPYNESHIKMIESFEQSNQLPATISQTIQEIAFSMPQEEYQKQQRTSNIIEEYVILEESEQAKDICHIHGEKDIKIGKLSLPSVASKRKKRRIIVLATDYAMNHLGMIEVFINVDKDDTTVASYLESEGYENLGEESSKIVYLKEKEAKDLGDVNYHETIR